MNAIRVVAVLVLGLCCQAPVPAVAAEVYPLRWVYVSRSLTQDAQVEEIRRIVSTGAAHGLNGMLLSAGFDRMDLQPPAYFRRLEQVKEICARHKVEIIPIGFSVGYGDAVLDHNPNLAAGLPVKKAPFVVRAGEARLVPERPNLIENGGFETFGAAAATGYTLPDEWGAVISRDTSIVKQGGSSLRFENFSGHAPESAMLGQVIRVKPYRQYRVSCWLKTEGLDSFKRFGSSRFRIEVITTANGRRLQFLDPAVPTTTDWTKVVVGFNSWGYNEVLISPRAVGGSAGKIWIDDLRVEEVGLLNVLRRPGTPLEVRSARDGTIYREGADFAPVKDPHLDSLWTHEPPPIVIPAGSRIRDGERLEVSYYHGAPVNRGQVSLCMSEQAVYRIWRTQLELIEQHLAPRRYFLSMDEVREGGSCKACKDRKLTMGEIFADCVTRQFKMIRSVNPQAEVFVWSDQLDPNHNAGTRTGSYYYLVDGLFGGSWNHVPRDLVIACWWHKMRNSSLAHFSGLGFKTIGASYYDADDLQNPKDWLESLDATPGAIGIMYTTWLNKYKLLAGFGDLVSNR